MSDKSNLFGGPPPEKGAPPPLADRMRPRTLEDFHGQRHLLREGAVLERIIRSGDPVSLILWGPPGTGKTTLARLMAEYAGARFLEFSAVLSGVKEIREAVRLARHERESTGRKTILFVDEIHRFNKAQQDAFLPHVEKGTVVLVGATTENPSFEVNAALLSRTRVFTLEPLDDDAVGAILDSALADGERGLGIRIILGDEERSWIIRFAEGDARRALSLLELAAPMAGPPEKGRLRLGMETLENAAQRKTLLYDKSGEEHYNLISALHKTLRDGDPDGALYWATRMMESGEDPLYILRRLVRFAVEDVGLADPRALTITLDATETYRMLGSPEGDLAVAEAVIYLAVTPKSNALYKAFGDAKEDVKQSLNRPVPKHLRNAPTKLMKNIGYGKGYAYAPDDPEGALVQDHLPGDLAGKRYYFPTPSGIEGRIRERLDEWLRRREEARVKKKEE